MSVVGFDIGNENCVVAVAKQRGIEVILNDESKRETPAVVSFGDKQRFLGSAGEASATMNPKSTIYQMKRLIGKRSNDPDIQEDIRMFPFSVIEGPDGCILIQIQYLGQTRTFTPVQILGMLFSHLKQIAEKNLGMPVADCVISIPSYFSDLERRAYLDAAYIAGLKPLRLMHDCTATALSYGIYKTDFGNSAPYYVAFADIGHCDTQVSIASFETGHFKIISHAFDRNLGGRNFDEILFKHFALRFRDDYGIDVCTNIRASIRLRAACEKLKRVLSANAEAPLNIECLMDEKDVKGFILREEFEKMSANLLERIKVPCSKALHEAGLSVDKINSVELVGSGSRIPAIAKTLSAIFKREPSRTLNASECVARGCALQCAMLSPVFRVKDYEVQDSFPFPIGISSDGNPTGILSSSIVFPKFQLIPSIKMLTFRRNATFTLDTYYADQADHRAGTPAKFCSFMIGPFQSDWHEARVKIRLRLNLHGIVTVESASLIEGEVHKVASFVGDNEVEKSSSGAPASMANVAENTLDSQPTHAAAFSENSHSAHICKTRGSARRIDIPFNETVHAGMTKADLAEAQEKELHLAQQDKLMELTKDKKNALEAYVYDMRNKLLDTYVGYATESEREEISTSLQQTEEWLYDDGDDESESVYTHKLDELKKLVDPIENRFKDEDARACATKDLQNCIVEYRMSVKSRAAYERDVVINECNKAEQWLWGKMQQQDSLPRNSDPILWSSEIKQRADELDMFCRHVLKPKVGENECKGPGFKSRTEEGLDSMDTDHHPPSSMKPE